MITKTAAEILEQQYINAKELQIIIPVNYIKALQYITDAQEEMQKKGYFVPESKTKVALTKFIRKRFGL